MQTHKALQCWSRFNHSMSGNSPVPEQQGRHSTAGRTRSLQIRGLDDELDRWGRASVPSSSSGCKGCEYCIKPCHLSASILSGFYPSMGARGLLWPPLQHVVCIVRKNSERGRPLVVFLSFSPTNSDLAGEFFGEMWGSEYRSWYPSTPRAQ